MKVRYENQQDQRDLMNGNEIGTIGELAKLLDERRNSEPFLAELAGQNGYELMIGLGSGVACAQYSRSDGEPPYLMAVAPQRRMKGRYVAFLMNNTPTEIPMRFILNFDEMKQIALYFLETGDRSGAFSWEEI
jgi:Immunity protein Imm1